MISDVMIEEVGSVRAWWNGIHNRLTAVFQIAFPTKTHRKTKLSAPSETVGVERIKFAETLTVSADGNRERSLLTNSGRNV